MPRTRNKGLKIVVFNREDQEQRLDILWNFVSETRVPFHRTRSLFLHTISKEDSTELLHGK